MPKCRQISGHCLCTATFLTLAIFSTILSGCGGKRAPANSQLHRRDSTERVTPSGDDPTIEGHRNLLRQL